MIEGRSELSDKVSDRISIDVPATMLARLLSAEIYPFFAVGFPRAFRGARNLSGKRLIGTGSKWVVTFVMVSIAFRKISGRDAFE